MYQKNILRLLFFQLIVFIVLGISVHSAFGADKKSMTAEEAKDIVKILAPDIKILSVEQSPVEGLWEAVIESRGKKGIVYIDQARKHIVLGNILNAATKVNLTQKKFDDINRVDVSIIPLDDAIVMGNKDAKHKVIVFDDPD